jgi:hypothetical protein
MIPESQEPGTWLACDTERHGFVLFSAYYIARRGGSRLAYGGV